jgi:cyclopropane-fatty-acyl-phospholipid synthase
MSRHRFRHRLQNLLAEAGIAINGTDQWDMEVHDDRVYPVILSRGSLGLGESYMDGLWDAVDLDQFFHRLLSTDLAERVTCWRDLCTCLFARLVNLQRPSRAFQVGRHHYDIGNDLYRRMLDERLIYSCGYWKNATTLAAAQEAKLDLVCRKLNLKPGMRVLDIGCGWGGAARFAAENYGVSVVGVTVSREQAAYAREWCKGWPVDIRLQDYRAISETFDRVFSIGMFEHVGFKNYRLFMQVVRRNLRPDGLFLLHTIGGNTTESTIDPWIDRYIFPNAVLPSKRQLCQALEGLFIMEDWHNFGVDYDTTLMAWFQNFDSSWPEISAQYSKRFYRMWKYYLLSCAGSFRARRSQVWQLVLSPAGVSGGYEAPR